MIRQPNHAIETFSPKHMNLGMLAAERETNALKSYFFESKAYQLLRDGKRSVVLGNRGAGKTALFKMLAEHHRAQGSIVIEILPEEYSYELLSTTMAAEDKGAWVKHGAYAAAWKYMLYVIAMKAYSLKPGLKTGASRRIYEYIRDNHGSFDRNPIGAIISYLKRLEGVKVGKFEASIKASELHKLYKLEELAGLLADIDNVSRNGPPIVILIDELDRGWDASEDAKAFIGGLFQAATTMPSVTPGIRVLISLRKELYDSIPSLYDDAQKFRDVIETVTWSKSEIFSLIVKRISHSFPQLDHLGPEAVWEKLFSKWADPQGRISTFDYIADRTLLRPREIIQLCNEVNSAAVTGGVSYPLSPEIIKRNEVGYSKERSQDISAEYRFQFPGLESVFESFRGLPAEMGRNELEMHCLKLAIGDIKVDAHAESWVGSAGPDNLIDILWRVGFLRAQITASRRTDNGERLQFVGSHEMQSLVLKNALRFHVHPMFRAGLGTI